MAKLSDLGERGLVKLLLDIFKDEDLGDDAAILPQGDHNLLLSTDVVNQATHIPPQATPQQVGWYAAAVNLSDIAAMGGEPIGFMAALTLPRETEISYLEGLAGGMQDCVGEYGATILGGDTKEGPEVSIAGVALGRTRGRRVLRRRGFGPGDLLAVTGELGRGGWAERRLQEGKETQEATRLLMEVRPRVAEGLLLAESDAVTACMDVSDGLATSLAQMRERGGYAFALDYERIPTATQVGGLSSEEKAEVLLHHGGDFELLFTTRPEGWDQLADGLHEVGNRATVIGEVIKSGENLLRVPGGERPLGGRGYEHFQ